MAGPEHGGAPRRKRAVLLVLRYYGGQMALLRRLAVPAMLLPALGSTGISYVAPLNTAAGRSRGPIQLSLGFRKRSGLDADGQPVVRALEGRSHDG